jgi:hypothetical protein
MAEARKQARSVAEALLLRLRRLTARAGSVDANDRAQLLVLLDDIQAVRRGLIKECARLDEEMKRTTAGVTAAKAYARSARLVGSLRQGGTR